MLKKFKIVSIAILVSSSFIFANPALFKAKKEFMLNHIDKKIELLNSFKSCISNATKHSDLKKCRQNHKASIKKLKEEAKAKREEFKSKK